MAAVMGYASQLGIDTANPVTKRFDFRSSTLGMDEEMVDTGGLRGELAHTIDRNRSGRRRINGDITLNPSPVELALLLPWVYGAVASGTTFPLGQAFTDRYVTIDKGAKVPVYSGCRVNKAVFRASEGGPLELVLSVVGVDETLGNAASFPVLAIDATTTPFLLQDCVLTANGAAAQSKMFELTIDYAIDVERFLMNPTVTALNPTDRIITVGLNVPYGDYVSLYGTGQGGIAINATFTNGLVSLALDFVKVVFPRKPIAVEGRGEIMLPLQGTAKKSGATLELVTTLDSTP
jgi:hypothetical protein